MLRDKNTLYLIIVLVIFLVLILATAYNMTVMDQLYQEFTALADSCYQSAIHGEIEAAILSAHELAQLWDNRHLYLSSTLNHEDIDNITISLSKAVTALEDQDFPSFHSEFMVLQKLIVSLKGMEELKLENIL